MAALHWVGRGSATWRDRRNWSSRPGGTGGASAPTGVEDVVLDGGSGDGVIDLRGCLYRRLHVRPDFEGSVVGPFGDEPFSLRPTADLAEAPDPVAPDVPRVVDFRPETPTRCPWCGQSDTHITGERSFSTPGPFDEQVGEWLDGRGLVGPEPVTFIWAEWVGDGVICDHSGPEIVDSLDLVGPYQAVE